MCKGDLKVLPPGAKYINWMSDAETNLQIAGGLLFERVILVKAIFSAVAVDSCTKRGSGYRHRACDNQKVAHLPQPDLWYHHDWSIFMTYPGHLSVLLRHNLIPVSDFEEIVIHARKVRFIKGEI
jgi:hypothetical protein